MFQWLIQGGVGPAVVALPVNWVAEELAGVSKRWFRRLRRADGLSRLVRAATGASVELTDDEFGAVRELLEDQQTWERIGRGTVEDLATLIASRLQGRQPEESLVISRTIARGLLEFAVSGLDADLFQRVLLARLDRLETNQATALDQAMLGVHADLAVWSARQVEVGAALTARVLAHLAQVLDRLPPGSADVGQVVIYLLKLSGWLNADPWPRDIRFDGPVLAQAEIERKLRVSDTNRVGHSDLDADELTGQCGRLVLLGEPGSGKTWLAKRTARRCADAALKALAAGTPIDEVELPLYTTCSAFYAADGDVRQAAVTSALNQTPDLGGSRITAALRELFTERNAQTLLVIDSLDEAPGPHDKLRRVASLPWRILLTSRPSSWNNQLDTAVAGGSLRVGYLRPLRYPQDTTEFIHRWFADQPSLGESLGAQIARREVLQEAATVPLLLTFYCIIGADGPLPEFRRDLYARVVRSLLTGRWRDSDDRDPDPDICLRILREWAWSGAAPDPVSGTGTWADEIPTRRARISESDRHALDHVAAPAGPPDLRTGLVFRRFIHRSIREHLVAEHVAVTMTASEAARELIGHIWFDPDWEYAAPAALTMHPARDQVLRELICLAADSDQPPEDLSVIDVGGEFRPFLARLAVESTDTAWSDMAARIISQARIDLAERGHLGSLSKAPGWEASDEQIREMLLEHQAKAHGGWYSETLAEQIAEINPTAEDLDRSKNNQLTHLIAETSPLLAAGQARAVAASHPTPDDLYRARQALLGLLPYATNGYDLKELAKALAALNPTPGERRNVIGWLTGFLDARIQRWAVWDVPSALAEFAHTEEERRHVRKTLLPLLTDRDADPYRIAKVIAGLAPSEQERRQVRNTLLRLFTSGILSGTLNEDMLVAELGNWELSATQRQQVLQGLFRRLAKKMPFELGAGSLGRSAALFAVTAEEKRRVREVLLGFLDRQAVGSEARHLTGVIAELDPTEEEQARMREILLALLAQAESGYDAAELARAVTQFSNNGADRAAIQEAMLAVIGRRNRDGREVAVYAAAEAAAMLAATTEERQRTLEAFLGLLVQQPSANLAGIAAKLDPGPEELRVIRGALLKLLAVQGSITLLAPQFRALNPTPEESREARQIMMKRLAGETSSPEARDLAFAVHQMGATKTELQRVRQALLSLMSQIRGKPDSPADDHSAPAIILAEAIAGLHPTTVELQLTRQVLLNLLAQRSGNANRIADAISLLHPTTDDIPSLQSSNTPLTTKLLTAIRRNSPASSWIAALPSLVS